MLDAVAVNALTERRHPSRRRLRQALEAARRIRRDVVIATVTLAELYRGASHRAELDAFLSREERDGLTLRDTDRHFARLVGSVLAEAGVGSEHLADAHAVAAAVEVGGGVVLTSDPNDLSRLAAPYGTIVIVPLS